MKSRRLASALQSALVLAVSASGIFSSSALAAAPRCAFGSPSVDALLPRGGQRGSEQEVTFFGQRLADAATVLFHEPGVELLAIAGVDEQHATAKFRIAPDCPLGEHKLRLVTRTGISELRTFWVSPFPNVDESEPANNFTDERDLAHLPVIARNVTVNGVITNEDVDAFLIEMKQGERLTAEVEGMRLAETLFDPFVAILDERRFELASNDDSALFRQDPVASCVIPADGRYVVLIRESSYGGNERCRYRLHVGTFPRPLVAFPAGVKPGFDGELSLLGDVKGPLPFHAVIPKDAPGEWTLFPEQEGVTAPSGCVVRVNGAESAKESEPNDSIAQVTTGSPSMPQGLPPPIALDGVLDHPGDVDFVRLALKKDERLHLRLHARSIRSPLDPVMSIHAANGQQIDASDDSIGLDSYFQFSAPADGDYFVRIADHLGAGGPTYVWRLMVTAVVPGFALDIPRFGRDPQARQMAPVPRGGRYALVVHAGRGAVGGDLALGAADLPEGVTVTAALMPKGSDSTLVLFEAAEAAPLAAFDPAAALARSSGAKLADLFADCAEPKLHGRLRQKFDLIVAPPNDTNFYDVTVDRFAVAVTEAAPFKIEIASPKIPLVRNGVVGLAVHATRQDGFKAPIVVRMLWLPPNVGAQPTMTIPEGQSDLVYTLNANGDAPPGDYRLAVLGEAESGRGVVFNASALTPLTLAPAFLSVKLDLAATEQGKPAQVVAHVEWATPPVAPNDGKATIRLEGLPAKCSAEPHEIAAGETQLVFDVTTAADTPVGKHTSLFVRVDVPLNGEKVTHYLGGGAILRVDPPAPPPVTAVAAAPEPPKPAEPAPAAPPAAPPKPLSRLEQLRQDALKEAQKKAASGTKPQGQQQ